MGFIKNWRRKRLLQRGLIPEAPWRAAMTDLPLLRGLSADDTRRLRELATLFLHEKTFETAQGAALTEHTRLRIAAQACLPILHLDLDWYADWRSLILYPGEFAHRREAMDENGVLHQWRELMSGEAWEQGGIILSLADVEASGLCDGYNVVIHELAHKLDMRNGEPNGFPPPHPGMRPAEWSAAFTTAYDGMCERVDHGEDTPIDPYATHDPAEFFAVMSEYFFEQPHLLLREYPDVYRQLVLFYRQEPDQRLPG